MGMFDELRCKYPLPVPGANDLLFQTKDTPEPLYMDMYEIREDGTLWRISNFANKRPPEPAPDPELQSAFVGEIRFYTSTGTMPNEGWLEFSAYFVRGKLLHLEVISQ